MSTSRILMAAAMFAGIALCGQGQANARIAGPVLSQAVPSNIETIAQRRQGKARKRGGMPKRLTPQQLQTLMQFMQFMPQEYQGMMSGAGQGMMSGFGQGMMPGLPK